MHLLPRPPGTHTAPPLLVSVARTEARLWRATASLALRGHADHFLEASEFHTCAELAITCRKARMAGRPRPVEDLVDNTR
eukprot:5273210-Prymnesium_polylepis.3